MREGINGLKMNCVASKKLYLFGFVLICILSFFYVFSNISSPFVFGFVSAYLFAPAIRFSSRYCNRTLVSFVFVGLFIAIFIAAGFVLLPKIKEYISYIADNLPTYYDNFLKFSDKLILSEDFMPYQDEIESLKKEVQKYSDQKLLILTSVLKEIVSKKNTIAGWMSFCVIAPISFYYFAKDWEKLSAVVYDIVPKRQHELVTNLFSIIRRSFRRFFHAQFYVVAVLSAYYSAMLWITGIDHSLFFGFFSGLLSFIPFIGAMIAWFVVVFLSVASLTGTKLWVLILVYILGQFVEGYILSPKFVGKGTGLHPLWILFAFFAGFNLLGILGVLISIPVTVMLRDLINFGICNYKSSQLYKQ